MGMNVQPAGGPGADPTTGLPEGWAERGAQRLAIAASIAAVCAAIAWALSPLMQPNVGGLREGHARPMVLVPVVFALSVATLLVARSPRIAAARRLDVGLGYLVAACFCGGIFRHWLPYETTDVVRGISGSAFAVLFFAVLVPVPPARMAVAAVLAALMDPLTLVLSIMNGNPAPRPTFWVWILVPGLVAVAISVFASRFIHILGKQVRRALEMGSYRLVRRLGAGGMGEVWLAQHQTLARPAALKLVKPEVLGAADEATSSAVRQRFEREAQATAMLSSPHTVELYDFGVGADGSLYYVMELLSGADLESLVHAHGKLPQARAVHILIQVCRSLSEAHRAGLVHRDIKPANIYLCRKGLDVDFVKVLDFGLVKVSKPTNGELAKLTSDGTVAGTAAYLPPEVAQDAEVDARADLYAVGCVAYWLVTGRLVFPAEGAFQQISAHLMREPEPPSKVVDGPIDDRLERLILQCLEKQPTDRPESCDELLERLVATGLADGWTQDEARSWWQEHEPEGGGGEDLGTAPTEAVPIGYSVTKMLPATPAG